MQRFFCLFLFLVGSLFSSEYEVVVEMDNRDIEKQLLAGLEDFNLKFFRRLDSSFDINEFSIYAKKKSGEVIGGVNGYLIESEKGNWIFVEHAWVEETMRHQGIGTRLFQELESWARTKDCAYLQLFTYAYQAVGFYKKLGFEQVGLIPQWIEGYDSVFFRKQLQ